MKQRGLVLSAFALGIVAAPLGWVSITSVTTSVIAQDVGSEDLIDIQPGERQFSRASADRRRQEPDQGLTEIQPVAEQSDPMADYLSLAKQKAQLLTPDELAHETQILRRELLELQATLKLRKAGQQLQQLIDEHPESGAAQRAKALLNVLHNPRSNSTFESPELIPAPEEDFEPVQARKRVRNVDPNLFDPSGNNDPFSAPPVRQNNQPVQPTKKLVPSSGPNRT